MAAPSPATSAIHSILTNAPNTARPATRAKSHSGLVAASTRSPALKTGPFPAKIWSTIRKLMKASSSIQRCDQPPTAIMNAGIHAGAASAARRQRRASGAWAVASAGASTAVIS